MDTFVSYVYVDEMLKFAHKLAIIDTYVYYVLYIYNKSIVDG